MRRVALMIAAAMVILAVLIFGGPSNGVQFRGGVCHEVPFDQQCPKGSVEP